MRIAHVILPDASQYERKSQRIDQAGLASKHEVLPVDTHTFRDTAADVVHFYGNDLAAKTVSGMKQRYIASADPRSGPFPFGFRRPLKPQFILSPVAPANPDARVQLLPEAVEEVYFGGDLRLEIGDSHPTNPRSPISNLQSPIANRRIIGSFARQSVTNMIEQTLARLQRTRDDVQWRVFESAPTSDDLRAVDLWVDPATSDDDFDGFVAEAIAAGKAVVASRTEINSQRLESGRTGFLVPPRDPNELTHAILTALFKPEVARLKIEAAKQTAGKFRPRQRLRVLERIYEALVP